MCRLLVTKFEKKCSPRKYLQQFANCAKQSKEYQGHGWGCAWWTGTKWKIYRNIQPIWEDTSVLIPRSKLFIAHARSAFQNKDIVIENNMPFGDEHSVFAFNGELRGVKLRIPGRTGAEKIFQLIKMNNRGMNGIITTVDILNQKTEYIRACNFIVAEGSTIYIHSLFNEDPDYFTLHYKDDQEFILSSMPLDATKWKCLPNGAVKVL